jgi:uncharacterized coiled-coil protein SlyX
MDTALIVTLIISITGNIAAWWQIAAQAKKDKRQADLEQDKNDDDVIARDNAYLQTQVADLRARVASQEEMLITKIAIIGELKMAGIDKDVELRLMKYKMDAMKMDAEEAVPMSLVIQNTDLPSKEKVEASMVMEKKNLIKNSTRMEIDKLRNNSINRQGE